MASKELNKAELAELREWYEVYTKKMLSLLKILTARMEYLKDDDITLDKGGYEMIFNVTSRIKAFDSACNKLLKKGKEINKEEFMSLTDLAGLRIVVNYKDYIEEIHELIKDQPGIEIIEVNDYVSKPKESGYRALHLVVRFTDQESQIPVEIQIRSKKENIWAEYEHDVQYKPESDTRPRDEAGKEQEKLVNKISERLKKLADDFNELEEIRITIRDNKYRDKDAYQ